MKPFNSLVWVTTVTSAVAFVLVGHAAPAAAYLDPGTGSMILQLILGGVAGAMVIGKLYWERVKAVFGFSSNEASTEELPPGSKARDTDAD